jgi:acyl-CoA thioester hydrolase
MSDHKTTIRVIYGDTDNMGQAYYGNYFRWFEIGRNEMFRSGAVKFEYKIFSERDHTLIAKGYTKHACLNGDGKVVRPPNFIRDVIQKNRLEP